jgi:tetratricopeptide (TPR) repeat protein
VSQLSITARRQGIYMKRMIVVLFLLVAFASGIHAQSSPRRRPIGNQNPTNGGAPGVVVSDPWEDLRLRLESSSPKTPTTTPPPQGQHLVPVSQLRIPSKAIREFQRSQKAFQSGDLRNSAEHLQKALQIYPDFIQAHNSLGLRFLQLGEYEKALAEHEAALALDPRLAQTHQDLSLALLLLNRSQEAETEARQALDLDSKAPASHYVLGRALLAQRRVTPEAIEMLRQSENALPNASLVLAQIYFAKGQTDQVIAELRHYLRAPTDPDNKQKAECWIAQLSQQPAPAACPADVTRPSFH